MNNDNMVVDASAPTSQTPGNALGGIAEANTSPDANAPVSETAPQSVASVPNPVAQYITMARQRMDAVIANWVPREFTDDERAKYQATTHELMKRIEDLSAQKEQLAPIIDSKVETYLFLTRVDYRTTFPRLFRLLDLPTEIICDIFRRVAWTSPDSASVRSRLNLTWVCRSWRKIALEDPNIWNAIWWNDGPHYIRSLTFLERCGNAPRDIRITDSVTKPMTVDALRMIMARIMPRINVVRMLIVILQEWDPLLFIVDQLRAVSFIDEPIIMDRLEFHRCGPPYVQLGAGYSGPYRLPIPLFGGVEVPSLRTLSMSGIHIDWNRSIVGNLVTLDLRKVPLNRAPTFDQFRAVLSRSPMLSKLILDGAGPNYVGRDPGVIDFPPISLPHLRTLALADFSAGYALYIFSQISAPNVRDLTVLNLQGEDYTPFFLAMTGRMKEVRILTLFNAELIEHPTSADGARAPAASARLAVTRWLESMPKVTFIRFGALHTNILNILLSDVDKVLLDEDRLFPENKVIFPDLKYLEWQRMRPRVVINWACARKTRYNLPLQKIYINEATANEINGDKNIQEALKACLAPGGGTFLLRPGHKAPEESVLQNE